MNRQGKQHRPADPRDLEQFLVAHLGALNTYVRVRMGGQLRAKESISDLVQSTCREILQAEPEVGHLDEQSLKLWLFRAAENKILNKVRHWRTAKRDVSREEHHGSRFPEGEYALLTAWDGSARSPSGVVMLQEEVERLEQAFQQLPTDYRDVITLFHIVGLPHAHIAREMDRSTEAVRMLLVRALARLGRILGR